MNISGKKEMFTCSVCRTEILDWCPNSRSVYWL